MHRGAVVDYVRFVAAVVDTGSAMRIAVTVPDLLGATSRTLERTARHGGA
jgi:hypothetical protein